MELKDQVVSLDLAKALKEAGVKQESLFYWFFDAHSFKPNWYIDLRNSTYSEEKRMSAFTSAEVGEWLPMDLSLLNTTPPRGIFGFRTKKVSDGSLWRIAYYKKNPKEKNRILHEVSDKNEAKARGQMLLYLIQQGLIQMSK